MPKYSVLIPAFNMEKYLESCLKSILDQSYTDYEIIIVDDGSQDSTALICDEYEKKYDFIHVIHQENKGLISSRRVALKAAKGEYIVFLDADDLLAEDFFEVLGNYITYDYDLIIFGYEIVDKHGNLLATKQGLYADNCNFDADDRGNLFLDLIIDKIPYLWMKVVKRSIIDCNNDYLEFKDIKMGEDILQSIYILDHFQKGVYIDKPLYKYRYLANSMSKNINYDYLRQFLIVMRQVERAISQNQGNMKLFYKRVIYMYDRFFLYFLKEKIDFKEYHTLYEKGNGDKLIKTAMSSISLKEKIRHAVFYPSFYIIAKTIATLYFGLIKK